ncbi:hypothetical protein [Nocardia asiatica]|uniref:hypothetical protein n=1 Tax=Nocardia asiatica TaxID=209252 RepID=UPI0002F371F9|nr:hypothetical protein [Nocardia asiatica]
MTTTATSITPFDVTTIPVYSLCDPSVVRFLASTMRFLYIENVPYRCTAQSMQLFYNPRTSTASLRSPICAEHVTDSHAAPTGGPVRIRPGYLLALANHVFEVHVDEGYDSIFPDLRLLTGA